MRRPLNGNPPVSCNHACHRARKSAGGTDYAVPVGTPVIAPFAGRYYQHANSAAGYYVRIVRDDGPIFFGMHLSAYVSIAQGSRVAEGQIIGYSGGRRGAPGAGSSTGPHLHANVDVRGVRHGMEEWLAANSSNPASPGGTPIEEDDMTPAQAQQLANVAAKVENIEKILATEPNAGTNRGIKGAIERVLFVLTNGTAPYGIQPVLNETQRMLAVHAKEE